MKFNEVEKSLKEGKKIKLKSWKNAYWYYDQENGVIMNHFEEDGSPDVPTSALFPPPVTFSGSWVTIGRLLVRKPLRFPLTLTPLVTLSTSSRLARRLPARVGTARGCSWCFAPEVKSLLTT